MSDEFVSRDIGCRLIHILKRLQGEKDVIIRTVGDFQFRAEGRLARVEDRLALLTDVLVYTSGSAYPFRLSNVTVNLCAVTSVSEFD